MKVTFGVLKRKSGLYSNPAIALKILYETTGRQG